MNLRIIILSILSLFFVSTIDGQIKKWTLEECIDYAIENNLSIKQFEFDFKNAKIDKLDALGSFIPTLNSNSSYAANSGLVLDQSRNQQVLGTINTASMGLSSGISIFEGLKRINNLRRAKINAISNQYKLDNLKDDIRISIIEAYLQILLNKESLKVFKSQYEVIEQDLKKTQELVTAGIIAKGDLLEVEATAANQEQQIVNGENNLLISKVSLSQLLQIEDYENFDVIDMNYNLPLSDILNSSPKEIYSKAVTFRNDIKMAESNIDIAVKDLQIAKSSIYPTLSFFFNYSTRYSSEFRDPITLNTYDFIYQFYSTDGISYGLQLNIPVLNNLSVKNNISRRKINLEKTKLQIKQSKLDLESNINRAYTDVKNFYKSYDASEKTLAARKLAYEYAKEQFNLGLMNSFDFSQSKSRVDSAEAELIRAKYNFIFRLKVLEFYFGLPIGLN